MRKNWAHSFLILVPLLVCLFLNSCTQLREPELKGARITGCDIKGLTSAVISFEFTLENPNKKSLSAESLSGSISKDGAVLATFEMNGDPIVAPPSATSTINSSVTIHIADPLALLAAGISLKDPDLTALTADADIRIKIGDISKRIHLKEYPLKELAYHLNL